MVKWPNDHATVKVYIFIASVSVESIFPPLTRVSRNLAYVMVAACGFNSKTADAAGVTQYRHLAAPFSLISDTT